MGLINISESQLRSMIENASDGFFVHDFQGHIIDVNKAAYQNLGYSRDELLMLTVFDFEGEIRKEDLLTKIWPSLEDEGNYIVHGIHVRKDGSKFPVDVNLTCFKCGEQSVIFALVRDMTEIENLRLHLENLAMTDELTCICNRRAFTDNLKKEISRSLRKHIKLSVLIIDIDFFKKINDTYGHQIGDKALKHFVLEASKTLRDEDLIGRIGGEEFAVLLPDTKVDDAYIIANRLRQKIEKSLLEVSGFKIQYTVSVGVESLKDKGISLSVLMNNADKALYKAKENGRNRVEIFGR